MRQTGGKGALSGEGFRNYVSRQEKSKRFPLSTLPLCVCHCSRDTAPTRDKDIIHPPAEGTRRKHDPGTLLIALFVTPNHVIVLTISRWVRVAGFQDLKLL